MKHPDALAFTHDSYGYMLTYRGQSIGGAGTLRRDGPRNGFMKAADLRMYRQAAERERTKLLAGKGQARFYEIIARIDAGAKA